MTDHALEVSARQRFKFGENWSLFLGSLSEEKIIAAEESLKQNLGVEDLRDKSFLDVGSGSGLFSLAARRLGARVQSFDYDPASVACTRELRAKYYPECKQWLVEEGSVLDANFLSKFGKFDVVYSWGVLHHTGAMWSSLENITAMVSPAEGKLFIAIYNDQGWPSSAWLAVKKLYNALPHGMRWLVVAPSFVRLWGPVTIKDCFRGRPFFTWRNYGKQSQRGMSPYRDVVDWVGGLPFEVAKPEEIFSFYHDKDFRLTRLKTCAGGKGCNEFVFMRSPSSASRESTRARQGPPQ